MYSAALRRRPEAVNTGELLLADPLSIRFSGFSETAFQLLAELRDQPGMGTYQALKEAIRDELFEPMSVFRDDVVANFVIPSSLEIETERNVFGRILKNDFGRGGTHHHVWFAFYRPSHRRLSDVQMLFSIHPEFFRVGISCPPHARTIVRAIQDQVPYFRDELRSVLSEIAPLENLRMEILGSKKQITEVEDPGEMMEAMTSASGWRIARIVPRPNAISAGRDLAMWTLETLPLLWPFYRLMLRMSNSHE